MAACIPGIAGDARRLRHLAEVRASGVGPECTGRRVGSLGCQERLSFGRGWSLAPGPSPQAPRADKPVRHLNRMMSSLNG